MAGGFLLVGLTELLGAFRLLTPLPVAIGWIAVLVAAVSVFGSPLRRFGRPWPPALRIDRRCGFFLFPLILLPATVAVTALVAPPNTADGMSYHLSRVAHWIQNRSVDFFPTNIPRQLHLAPLSEYAALNLQLLWGSDRLANLVQTVYMSGSLPLAAKLAGRLGADRRGRLFGAVFAVTLPMGILQGSSVQTDWGVAFWLLAFVTLGLEPDRRGATWTAMSGIALGLAMLTKATALLYAAPVAAWLLFRDLRRHGRRALTAWGFVPLVALLINLPHLSRNLDLYGRPLGPNEEGPGYSYTNERFGTGTLISNAARNLGLHLDTPSVRLNARIESAILELHRRLELDPADPRTTWPGSRFSVGRSIEHEDGSGNLLHLLIIVVALGLIPMMSTDREGSTLIGYAAAGVATFLLFCLILKWQPWHSRLHLPGFVLMGPVVAAVVARGRGWLMPLLVALLTLGALPALLFNHSRPLLGERSILSQPRSVQYFANRPALAQPYFDVVDRLLTLPECREIGLISGGDAYEYPLWALLDGRALPARRSDSAIRIEHLEVENRSRLLYRPPFDPCVIVALDGRRPSSSPWVALLRRPTPFGEVALYHRPRAEARTSP